eukprot:1161744-Pelagomonas_calceolata.AAC.13
MTCDAHANTQQRHTLSGMSLVMARRQWHTHNMCITKHIGMKAHLVWHVLGNGKAAMAHP